MTVDIELLLGLVDLLHNDITDRRHIQLADGIKALAAENGRLKEHQTKTTRAWRKSEEREHALAAENERLKGLVEEAKQYAVHRSFCARDLSYAKCPCDCGYADWLARAEEDAK